MKSIGLMGVSALLEEPKKPLLLLNKGLLGIRYIQQVLKSPVATITPKGSTTILAPELWGCILDYAQDETEKRFCFVQAVSLDDLSPSSSSSTSSTLSQLQGKILHCREVELVGDPRCGKLEDADDVQEFEYFMADPHRPLYFATLAVQTVESPASTFRVIITSADDALPATTPCLFANPTVADVISFIEDGRCSFCDGGRFFCPGCTGGMAQRFGLFMGCGVNLACPLCMGVAFAREHKEFLELYYDDDPPAKEEERVQEWIRQREEELGYY